MTRIALVTLVVDEYDRAIDYYVHRLGFQLTEDTDLGNGKRWVVVAPPGSQATGLLLARAVTDDQRARVGNQTGGRVAFFLETEDFESDYDRFTDAGVTIEQAPREEAYGHVAVFRDVYGNRWDLVQPARAR